MRNQPPFGSSFRHLDWSPVNEGGYYDVTDVYFHHHPLFQNDTFSASTDAHMQVLVPFHIVSDEIITNHTPTHLPNRALSSTQCQGCH